MKVEPSVSPQALEFLDRIFAETAPNLKVICDLDSVDACIRSALAAHLTALGTLGREPQLTADVTVLARDVYATRRDSFRFVGIGALLGRGASRAKAASSRSNGRKGGRPPAAAGRAIHAS